MPTILKARNEANAVTSTVISMWDSTLFSVLNDNHIHDLVEIDHEEHELDDGTSLFTTTYECDFAGFEAAVNDNDADETAINDMRLLVADGTAAGASKLVIVQHS